MRCVIPIVLLLAGCDGLADRGYVGSPMFTLVGTFTSTSAAPDDSVGGVALMWQDAAGAGGPGVAITAVPVSIQFPARFRVDVPLPPPQAARFQFDDGDVTIAEAFLYVVGDPAAPFPEPRGLDRTHALVWASADVTPGTLAADYLGGPVAAGYHLRKFAATDSPGAAQRALIERCAAGGAARTACEGRRGYQLAGAGDDEPLRIGVSPP
jgi:hypothetical protein